MTKTIKFYYGEACIKCEFLKPKIQELCEKKGYELELIDGSTVEGLTSVPYMEVDGEGYDYDGIINFYFDNQ